METRICFYDIMHIHVCIHLMNIHKKISDISYKYSQRGKLSKNLDN